MQTVKCSVHGVYYTFPIYTYPAAGNVQIFQWYQGNHAPHSHSCVLDYLTCYLDNGYSIDVVDL